MLIFLYGPDSYRRQKKLNKIIEEYRQKYSHLSYNCFDLENPDEFLRLKEFAAQPLIFDNKKLAVLKNAFAADLKNMKEFLETYFSEKDLTILISEENPAPLELKSVLEKSFLIEKFDFLEGNKWLFFIQKEAAQRKISLTSRAVYFLAKNFKNDTWGLINELDKASLLNKSEPIDIDDLKTIGDYSWESPAIFDFINRVVRNWSKSEKIIALERLFISHQEPARIFNIMASLKRLPRPLIQKLADYDVMVKSGKLDYEEILLDLALE